MDAIFGVATSVIVRPRDGIISWSMQARSSGLGIERYLIFRLGCMAVASKSVYYFHCFDSMIDLLLGAMEIWLSYSAAHIVPGPRMTSSRDMDGNIQRLPSLLHGSLVKVAQGSTIL